MWLFTLPSPPPKPHTLSSDKPNAIQPGLLHVFRVLTLFWFVTEVAALLLDMADRNIAIELTPYMFVTIVDRVVLLIYLFMPGLPRRLGVWYLPIGIIIAALGPVVSSQLFAVFAPQPVRPPNGRPSTSLLILLNRERLPYIYLPLILTAWQYGLRGVSAFTLAYVVIAYFFPMGRQPHDFTVRLLMTVVQLASFGTIGYLVARLISEQHKQREALARANTKLSNYADTMEQLAASRERNRLAHELHDTLAHTQSALAVQLEGVRALWHTDNTEAFDLLEKSIENTRNGLTETRRALRSLRASPLEELGLAAALENLLQGAAERGNLQLTLTVDNAHGSLSPNVEQCIYRIAQEAMENVIRHADATHVIAMLTHNADGVRFSLRDDGHGFDPAAIDSEYTFGLMGIHERAAIVGGQSSVQSQRGTGTIVIFERGADV